MSGYSQRFGAVRTLVTTRYAYLSQAVFAMQPVEIVDMMTKWGAPMAVDPYWRVYYDPTWLDGVTPEEGMAVMIHEVWHLLRDHRKRCEQMNADAMVITASGHTIPLWNIAGDAEINDDLEDEKLKLPGDYVNPDKLQLPRNNIAEFYYKKLFDKAKKQQQQGGQGTPQAGQGPQGKGGGQQAPPGAKNAQNCGSGADGQQRPWEHEAPGGQQQSGEAASPGVDPVKAEMLRRETAREIQEHARQAGNMPAGYKRWADALMTSKVDYWALIRATLRASLQVCTMGRADYTYRRPARRQSAYGNFVMPSMYQPKPRIGVLIDTSGSMSETDLGQAIAEVDGVLRATQTEVVVAACDAEVHNVKKVFKKDDIELLGGGGTDMGRGIKTMCELKPKIDLLIVVTDCYTSWPSEPPVDTVVIRVNKGEPPPWGRVITIEPGE